MGYLYDMNLILLSLSLSESFSILTLPLFVHFFCYSNLYRLVEETLTPLDPDRRAFRLVGGVLVSLSLVHRQYDLILYVREILNQNFLLYVINPLQVERTVREVLPTVKEMRGNLEAFVNKMKEQLDAKQKEAAAWKAKYNIKTQEEAEAANRQ